MAEYIEREAFRREIDEHRPGRSYEDAWALTILDSIPAADVVPVRHGRWERASKSLMVCTACGNCVVDDRISGMFYCPNCGADMREKE